METNKPVEIFINLKNFNNIEEVMAYPLTKEKVEEQIEHLRKERRTRPLPPPGRRYVRDAVDIMMDENELNTDFMIDHYLGVYHKVSNIPYSKRQVMHFICQNAINAVIRSLHVSIKEGDKLNVEGSKAKLNIIKFDKEKNTVKVMMLKKTEVWGIDQLATSLVRGDLSIIK
jgi:hypothetical protein